MSKKVFTDQEVGMLRGNPYTYAVTPHILSFTKEFKEPFWKEYQTGAIPRQILEKCGYPADVLGKGRIWGIAHVIKKQDYSPEGLHEGSLPKTGQATAADGRATEEQIKQIQGEVQSLRQEIGFLKKLSPIRTTRCIAYEGFFVCVRGD